MERIMNVKAPKTGYRFQGTQRKTSLPLLADGICEAIPNEWPVLLRFGPRGMVARTLAAFPSCIAMLILWAKKEPDIIIYGNEIFKLIPIITVYMLEASHHERTPRLEEFFWTGSGDGPPVPAELPTPTARDPSPVVRTTTVLATVYLDSYPAQAVTDKSTGECILNCGDPSEPGSLEPEVPDDRRYWLLTVIQGTTPDSLQLRLARLYQKAFLRQQERHLGIIKSLDAPPARRKHDVHSFLVNNEDNDAKIDKYPENQIQSSMSIFLNEQTVNVSDIHNSSTILKSIEPTKLSEIKTWILATPTVMFNKRKVATDREELSDDKEELTDFPLEAESSNETVIFKREIIKPEHQPPVHVHIQNITEQAESGSVKIVYVVMVGGRAVPAAVAARDMRLVRDAEVATELGAVVTTKAEPAYLKAAEGLSGEEAPSRGVHGTELWALSIGGSVALLILIILLVLLCRLVRRKKSAASLRAYRNELLQEVGRNQLKTVHEEKDGRLISVVSPSRTRPSSTMLPVYRATSASSTSTTSSVLEVTSAMRRRQKKSHALRMPQKKRVGTTDSLLASAGLGDSSDSAKDISAPATPTSYLSMPSVRSFPRGNIVEPLSRVLEPISVRHLDLDSPINSPKGKPKLELPKVKSSQDRGQGTDSDMVPRRQMSSQLVRLGSIDKDPGVVGPLVWDLHCQRIRDVDPKQSPTKSVGSTKKDASNVSRMRLRFNELVDDAFSLFGSPGSSPKSGVTYTVPDERKQVEKKPEIEGLTQARNDNVRLPGSPYTAMDTVRGKSAGIRNQQVQEEPAFRPRTSIARPVAEKRMPARAWGTTPPQSLGGITSRQPPIPTVNPAIILAQGKLPPDDPALPLISAIKSEIQRVRDSNLHKSNSN